MLKHTTIRMIGVEAGGRGTNLGEHATTSASVDGAFRTFSAEAVT